MTSSISDMRDILACFKTLLEVLDKLDGSWKDDFSYDTQRFNIHDATIRQAKKLKLTVRKLLDSTRDIEDAGLVKRAMTVFDQSEG